MKHAWIVGIALLGCGKKSSEAPPPPKPATGAPIAFEVTKITPGDHMKGVLEMRGYNFSDKTIAQYWVLMRYLDASGAVMTLQKGTPFEGKDDHYSFSGNRYACEPKHWCDFKIDNIDVPAGAAKAEVIAKQVTAKKDDMSFEDQPLYKLDGMHWPEAAGSAK